MTIGPGEITLGADRKGGARKRLAPRRDKKATIEYTDTAALGHALQQAIAHAEV